MTDLGKLFSFEKPASTPAPAHTPAQRNAALDTPQPDAALPDGSTLEVKSMQALSAHALQTGAIDEAEHELNLTFLGVAPTPTPAPLPPQGGPMYVPPAPKPDRKALYDAKLEMFARRRSRIKEMREKIADKRQHKSALRAQYLQELEKAQALCETDIQMLQEELQHMLNIPADDWDKHYPL